MNLKTTLPVFALLFCLTESFSQTIKQFDLRFGGNDVDVLHSVIQTTDGGYVMGGSSASIAGGDRTQASQGDNDYWVVRLDSNNTKLWDFRFGGSGNDQLIEVQQTSDGGFILGGFSNSPVSSDKSQGTQGAEDYWIVKINSAGIKQWDARFGGGASDLLQSIKQTTDGGYILGGYSSSLLSGDKSQGSQGGNDYWVVKVNSLGGKVWDFRFGGTGDDECTSIQQTSDGNYILGGFSSSGANGDKSQSSRGGSDFWMVKISSAGTKLSDFRFGGSGTDILFSIQQTSDLGYILAGYSSSGLSGDKSQFTRGGMDYWVVKVTAAGTKDWDARFGGSSDDFAFAIKQTVDGGFVLGGYSDSGTFLSDKSQASQGDNDFWVLKISGLGVKIWDVTFGGTQSDELYSLQQTSDKNYILAGSSFSGVSGDRSQASRGSSDYWIVKLTDLKTNSPATNSFCTGNTLPVTYSSNILFTTGNVFTAQLSNANGIFNSPLNIGTLNSTSASGSINAAIPASTPPGSNYRIRVVSSFPYKTGSYTDANIVINPTPVINPSNDSICPGDSITLTSSAAASYLWSNGQTAQSIVVKSPNVYAVTVNNSTCSNTSSVSFISYLSSVTTKEWDARFGGLGSEDLEYMQQTTDGGYILGGSSSSENTGDKSQTSRGGNDYWIVKLNSNRVKVWDARFGGLGSERLETILQTADGGYLLGGYSDSPPSGDKSQNSQGGMDYWVVKVNGLGVKLWDFRYGGSGEDALHSMDYTNDGGYILGGSSSSPVSGDKSQGSQGTSDFWIVKIDQNGVKVWDKRFGGAASDIIFSVHHTNDGGYILGGDSNSDTGGDKSQDSRGGSDFWVVKVNSLGVKQWDARFGGNSSEQMYSIIETSDGGYLGGGFSISGLSGDRSFSSYGGSDFWAVKMSSLGVKEWDVRYGGSAEDVLSVILEIPGNGYLLGGRSSSGISGDKNTTTQGGLDYWLVKISTFGNKEWETRFGGSGNDLLETMQVTNDGGVVMGGFSTSGISGDRSQASQGADDFWIVKLESLNQVNANGPTTFCTGGSVTLTAVGGHNWLWNTGATTQSVVASGTGNYSVLVNGCFNSNAVPVLDTNCSVNLILNAFVEGYYLGGGTMIAAIDPVLYPSVCDTFIVELHTANFPYNISAFDTSILNTSGTGTFSFSPGIQNQNLYIAVRHRNAIETWSASPVLFTFPNNNYSFKNAINKAYGNNLTPLGDGNFAIWSGDISDAATSTIGRQDGVVESQDYGDMENAVNVTLFGYIPQDITGDGLVESADYSLMENNVFLVVFSMRP